MSNTSSFLNAFQQYGAKYSGMYAEAARQTGVPASILAAQDYAESTFGTQVGNGGGIAQFEPNTAQGELGLSIQQLQNPGTGILAQAEYMQILLQRTGGNMQAALADYNQGSPNATGIAYANGIIQNAQALGDTAATSGQLTATQAMNQIPAPSQQTLQQAAASGAQNNSGCPSIGLSPSSWVAWAECEGLNMLFIGLGVAGAVIVFSSMFKVSPVEIAAAVAGG